WENYFPSGETYTVEVTFSGDSATGTIESSEGTEYPAGTSITVDFKNDPEDSGGLFGGGETDNYKIIRLELDNDVIVE
ncbi:MAG: hypothetical protein ACLFPW_07330, partial [Spirochaetaceae bacterium]